MQQNIKNYYIYIYKVWPELIVELFIGANFYFFYFSSSRTILLQNACSNGLDCPAMKINKKWASTFITIGKGRVEMEDNSSNLNQLAYTLPLPESPSKNYYIRQWKGTQERLREINKSRSSLWAKESTQKTN